MFEDTYFMKTQDLLQRGMNNAMVRRKVISDNIANADVPHFKRSDVSFEANLQRALDSEKVEAEKAVPTKITNEKHMDFFKPLNYKDVKPKVQIDYLTTMRADGNNVDIEKEVVTAAENQMAYSMMAERVNQNYRLLNIVMRLA
ncbi:MAG: flagellar basal body rod protein FlgB [Leptospiraceae bacterium]|nr:flagellar basal body rod protein FlgB [Leptospiraceae bacterium]MCP5499723.1 flagellar basal body rod protein FlgB [Leptospiraceae bacterium]